MPSFQSLLHPCSVFFLLLLSAVSLPADPLVEVLVVYTPAVRQHHGGTDGVAAHVDALIASTNLAFADSGIAGRISLVHLAEVDYGEDPDSMGTDLGRLATAGDGFMDEVPGLRDAWGADLVCLLRLDAAGGAAGVARQLLDTTGAPSVAFSVVGTQFGLNGTFPHELGHNLGASHAIGDAFAGQPAWGGLFEYSNGYRFFASDQQQYSTVMAYSPGRRILHFSNPQVEFKGAATGRTAGESEPADNARTLNETMGLVAAYREHQPRTPLIVRQPVDRVRGTPGTAILSLHATGSPPLMVQWYSGLSGDTSSPIAGATALSFETPELTSNTAYWARVSNPHGDADSQTCRVRFQDAPPGVSWTDQEQSASDRSYVCDTKALWREFRPTLDYLDTVELPLWRFGNPAGSLQVAITDAFGLPLFQQTLNGSAVVNAWNSVTFGVFLQPGQTYRIRLQTTHPSDAQNFFAWQSLGSNFSYRTRGRDSAATRVLVLSGPADFGEVPLGQTSSGLVTLGNQGTAPLSVHALGLTEGFSSESTGFVLLPGENRQVALGITPAQVGVMSGTLTVDSDRSSGTNTLNLRATAVDRGIPLADTSLDQAQQSQSVQILYSSTPLWQEVVPAVDYLERVELVLYRLGLPGSLIVTLQDANGVAVVRRTLAPLSVLHAQWTPIPLGVFVTPGQTYRIVVESTQPGTSEARYLWIGQSGNPYAAGASSVAGIDFTFRLYGRSSLAPYVRIDPDSAAVVAAGQSYPIQVLSNTNWAVAGLPAWASAQPLSGSGNATVTLTVAPNPATSSRSAQLTLGGRSHALQQAGSAPYVNLEPGSQSVAAEGADYTLAVSSNTAWTVSAPDWLLVTPGSGTGDAVLSVTVSPNPSTSPRAASLVVGTAQHQVSQAGAVAFVTIDPQSHTASANAQSYTLQVQSNTAWSVGGLPDWASAHPLSGNGPGSIAILVQHNATTSARSASITIGGSVHTLTQAAAEEVAPFTVSNVQARQLPGTRTMEITYDLTGSETAAVALRGSADAGATWSLPTHTLSGSGIGAFVSPGVGRTILWDMGTDWPGQVSNSLLFEITATRAVVQAGEYLVIDLSGGASAVSYPVGYLTSVPDGGWTDEYKTTKLVLRRIPAGTFTMGSPDGELGRRINETQHQVTLTKDFFIGVFEVTQRQWELVMGNRPSFFNNLEYYQKRPVENVSYYEIRENSNNSDDPVVDWPNNTQVNGGSFIGRLRNKTGLAALDLPTEAEWEYACRAGTVSALNSGNNLTMSSTDSALNVLGRYAGNNPGGSTSQSTMTPDQGGTKEVGCYQTNLFGLYDMHGNVWEWCLDWYLVDLGPNQAIDPFGPYSGAGRSFRGGSYDYWADSCRSATRYAWHLGYNPPNGKWRNFGLRVTLSDTPPTPTGMALVQGGALPVSSQLGAVVVGTFYIGKFEVTWGEWQTVRTWAAANGYDIGTRGAGCADNHPVRSVAWYDVVKWCNAKSQKEGLTPVYTVSGTTYKSGEPTHTSIAQNLSASGYRLPTEAEWEFAARGGNQTHGYTYSGSIDLNAVGWYYDNSGGAACNLSSGRGTWPVGHKAANELGLHDMSGNVWEWCWDVVSSNRRIRGGSWGGAADYCTVSYRRNFHPDYRNNLNGFRLARSSVESTPQTGIIGLSGDLAFGQVTIGQIATRTLTIQNTGNSSLTVSGITHPDGFSGNWSGGTIAAGGSQPVTVTFAPTLAQSYSGDIIVTSDATIGTNTLAVSGTGVAVVQADDYLVIDLSGGASATAYPVSYLTAVPGGGWTDEYKTTKLVLRRIPAGTFTMGSPSGELGRESDETQHPVTLTKDFYLGVFEVTQRQWELVMGDKPSYFNNASHYTTRPVEQVSYYDIRENPANSDDPAVNWPANGVVNASSFMGKLRAKTGLAELDLPTEAQWEYACRAGTTTALNSGVNLTNFEQDEAMDLLGRYQYNGGHPYHSDSDPSNGTAKVGSYQPNLWGLYDMHGNVYEWCLDWYASYPGSVTDPLGAVSGTFRVQRGGSWDSYAGHCPSADRIWPRPSYRDSYRGFRLARTLP